MSIFVSKCPNLRIKLESGGERLSGGKLKKFATRWVSFGDGGQVNIDNPRDIKKMKDKPEYGKLFTMLAKGEPKIKMPKGIKNEAQVVAELLKE